MRPCSCLPGRTEQEQVGLCHRRSVCEEEGNLWIRLALCVKVEEEEQRARQNREDGNCVPGARGGSVCELTERGGEEIRRGKLSLLTPSCCHLTAGREETEREVLTYGGPTPPPQRIKGKRCCYHLGCAAGGTSSSSEPTEAGRFLSPPCGAALIVRLSPRCFSFFFKSSILISTTFQLASCPNVHRILVSMTTQYLVV